MPGTSTAGDNTTQAGGQQLTQADAYTLALKAGLPPDKAKIAAAIAMAENAGALNPNAHNTTPPDDSYGLWQINLYGPLASRVHQFGLNSPADLYSPVTNAKAMAVISAKGTNFTPWSTYKDGAYTKYMSNPVSDQTSNPGWLNAIGSTIAAPFTDAASVAQAAGDAVQVIGKAAEWISKSSNWIRVLYVLGGATVLVVGVATVLKGTQVGEAATTATKAATNVGAAVATDGATLAAQGAAKGAGAGTANRIRGRKVKAHKESEAARKAAEAARKAADKTKGGST